MLLLLQKVVHEDDHEHSGHDEIKSLGVERKKSTEQAAQRRARNPAAPVQHRHPQVEPAAVNLRRHVSGAGDGEGFVAQAKDEQHRHGDIFQRTAENCHRHAHRVEERKALGVHQQTIREAKEEKARQNRQRVGKSRPKRALDVPHGALGIFADDSSEYAGASEETGCMGNDLPVKYRALVGIIQRKSAAVKQGCNSRKVMVY